MKRNIALVTCGFCGEAVISYKAQLTIRPINLDATKFNVYKVYQIYPNGFGFFTKPRWQQEPGINKK